MDNTQSHIFEILFPIIVPPLDIASVPTKQIIWSRRKCVFHIKEKAFPKQKSEPGNLFAGAL